MKNRQNYFKSLIGRLLLSFAFSLVAYLGLSLLNSWTSEWTGTIFKDLQPEAIGIVTTVMLIDWIIKMSEEREWESVRLRVNFRVREAYRKSGIVFRYSGPYPDSLLKELLTKDPNIISKIASEHYSVIQIFRDKYSELGYEKRWEAATPMYWATITVSLRGVVDACERLIDLFGKTLTPGVQSALDELASACEQAGSHSHIISTLKADKTDLHVMEMLFENVFRKHKALGELMENMDIS